MTTLSAVPHLVRTLVHSHAQAVADHPRTAIASAVGFVGLVGVVLYLRLRKKISPEEQERLRRKFLCTAGRLTDGEIVDTAEEGIGVPNSSFVVYQYRIAGVEYECSQDLSALPEEMQDLRIDLPVQVRYDARNPGNSIVAAEEWSGLQHGRAIATGISSHREEAS